MGERSLVTDSSVAESPTPTNETTTRSARERWTLVVGASLVSVALSAYEIAPASITPLVRESLGIGASTAGLLVSVMFGAAVVASLPAGAVLDRTDSRAAIAVAVGGLLVAGAWGWPAGGEHADRGRPARVLDRLAHDVDAGVPHDDVREPTEHPRSE